MTNPYDERRARIASLRREASLDVKNLGFISGAVAMELEHLGVDVAQIERDLLDSNPSN